MSVWRKTSGGIYTQDDFNTWRAHFGRSLFPGSDSGATGGAPPWSSAPSIPEPSTFALRAFATMLLFTLKCELRQ